MDRSRRASFWGTQEASYSASSPAKGGWECNPRSSLHLGLFLIGLSQYVKRLIVSFLGNSRDLYYENGASQSLADLDPDFSIAIGQKGSFTITRWMPSVSNCPM